MRLVVSWTEIPGESTTSGRLREVGAGVRVVGLVHQHPVAADADDRLRHRPALVELDAAEDAPLAGVAERRLLEIGDGCTSCTQPGPRGAPASRAASRRCTRRNRSGAAGSGRTSPRSARYPGQALRPPRMGGGTGDDDVPPDVAVAGEVGRLVEEGVVEDRQVGPVEGPPDGVEAGVVDRKSFGQHDRGGGDVLLPRQLLEIGGGTFGRRSRRRARSPSGASDPPSSRWRCSGGRRRRSRAPGRHPAPTPPSRRWPG